LATELDIGVGVVTWIACLSKGRGAKSEAAKEIIAASQVVPLNFYRDPRLGVLSCS